MTFVVVDSIVNSGRLCSLTCYSDTYKYDFQTILHSSSVEPKKWKQGTEILCFDAFKILDVADFTIPVWDVKVLYELAGYRFRNLIDLSREVLGEGRTLKYVGFSEKVKAHLRSYREAKIDIGQYNLEKLLPAHLLKSLYQERAMLVSELYRRFDNGEVVNFYKNRFFSVIQMLHEISLEPIKLDTSGIGETKSHFAENLKNQGSEVRLKFNAVGAKTGRLAFKKGTLNIYNLPRQLRHCIVAPENYKIVELDYKSFQPRLAIFSTDDEAFKDRFDGIEDIYSVFPGDREKNKISFLAWMFSLSKNEMFEKEASAIQNYRTKLFHETKKCGRLLNRFGRFMKHSGEEKNVVFQNFVTSLEVDSVLDACVWINDFLRDKQSRVLYPFHDAIVCLIHDDEMELLEDIKDYMENKSTGLGHHFPVEVKIGRDFGFEG